ncbi:MAG: hypothetical protein VCD66_13600, partial [Alphaproteobacteria bacterium]
QMLDGEVDLSGDREEADEMYSVLDSMFLPKGQDPSPWHGSPEHIQIRDMLNQSNCVSTGGENGLTAEFQFGEGTSMMQVITNDPNPTIGSGVGIFLHLPMWGTFEDASMIAGALNRAEANNKAPSHLVGSWCAKTKGEQSLPAFALFVPSALHQPGLLMNLVISAATRAGWAGQLLNPDADPADVNSIIMDRLGAMASPNET